MRWLSVRRSVTNRGDEQSMKTNSDNATLPGSDIVVFSIVRETACSECSAELWKGSFLRMENGKPLCMECADMDHLVYVPRGDTALTRRSRKYSTLSAVVVRFSRTRRRYERQGILVEPGALKRAEKECLSDEEQRRIARERASAARERQDQQYIRGFAEASDPVFQAARRWRRKPLRPTRARNIAAGSAVPPRRRNSMLKPSN